MSGPLSDRIAEAYQLLDQAIDEHVAGAGKRLRGICTLFSGGNDSTVLAHLMRERSTHAIHANTGIGIDETRQFVRDRCSEWTPRLIEEHPPPGSTYRELVIDQGFPGPAHHWKMYQRLKERALRKARRRLISRPHRERVIFLAGRRRDESKRRMNVPEMERQGSTVWVSPLVNWTAADMSAYRALHNLPRNEVSDNLHMSGECLCGAFAAPGEFEQIEFFYPEVAVHIRGLEREVRAAGHPEARCHWGWGHRIIGGVPAASLKSGPLCSSCDARRLAR